ncbi:MAG: dTDP-4-dehydrorhamnose 3,5-epimerase [Saprospiraceae bacterium]
MNILKTAIADLIIIEPKIWGDERGYFMETYSKNVFENNGLNFDWIQDNEAFSTRGVLRGLHYQTSDVAQTKLVRVAQGEILDVVVDLRKDSLSYGKSFSIVLSDTNKKQLLVPRGLAHGYVVLSASALFLYKVDNPYIPAKEAGILYNDPALEIDWILEEKDLIISEKDKVQPIFKNHTPYN